MSNNNCDINASLETFYGNTTMFGRYPDLLSVKDVSKALGIGKTFAYQLVRSGQIRSFRIGRAYRVPKRYLIEFLMEQSSN